MSNLRAKARFVSLKLPYRKEIEMKTLQKGLIVLAITSAIAVTLGAGPALCTPDLDKMSSDSGILESQGSIIFPDPVKADTDDSKAPDGGASWGKDSQQTEDEILASGAKIHMFAEKGYVIPQVSIIYPDPVEVDPDDSKVPPGGNSGDEKKSGKSSDDYTIVKTVTYSPDAKDVQTTYYIYDSNGDLVMTLDEENFNEWKSKHSEEGGSGDEKKPKKSKRPPPDMVIIPPDPIKVDPKPDDPEESKDGNKVISIANPEKGPATLMDRLPKSLAGEVKLKSAPKAERGAAGRPVPRLKVVLSDRGAVKISTRSMAKPHSRMRVVGIGSARAIPPRIPGRATSPRPSQKLVPGATPRLSLDRPSNSANLKSIGVPPMVPRDRLSKANSTLYCCPPIAEVAPVQFTLVGADRPQVHPSMEGWRHRPLHNVQLRPARMIPPHRR